MQVKYLINLNSNHYIDKTNLAYEYLTTVFKQNLSPYQYKQEKILREICIDSIEQINAFEEGSALGKDEPVYVIYSGLAVVLLAFIGELILQGYKPVVLFEDKDNGGYYKMEVTERW